MLSDKKESTSRISWFRILFKHLNKSDISPFLEDLSSNISIYYDETSSNNQNNEIGDNPVLNSDVIENKSVVPKKSLSPIVGRMMNIINGFTN